MQHVPDDDDMVARFIQRRPSDGYEIGRRTSVCMWYVFVNQICVEKKRVCVVADILNGPIIRVLISNRKGFVCSAPEFYWTSKLNAIQLLLLLDESVAPWVCLLLWSWIKGGDTIADTVSFKSTQCVFVGVIVLDIWSTRIRVRGV